MKPEFTTKLLEWNAGANKRSLPWKGEKDPYKIWLCEVILQQTRVEQGTEYYEKFVRAYPTIHDLAQAPDEKVFKSWEGLGYYSRCKNLLASARMICKNYNGVFPATYQQLLSLKGVGPYTAAAIASFAFDLPHAVVDGNVVRVISRYFGINAPVDTKDGKELYAELADALLDKADPATFNQAIMDFGATVCKPMKPLCAECIQKNDCQAFQHGWVEILPTKQKSVIRKERWFTYYFVIYKDQVYIRKRTAKDIWANLFEFILQESSNETGQSHAVRRETIRSVLGTDQFHIQSISIYFKQQLTHQTISGQFVTIVLENPLTNSAYQLIPKSGLNEYAFPRFINSFLELQ